jgi:hypothetical protein
MTELPAARGGTSIHRTTPLSRTPILSALFLAAPATPQESAPAFIGSAACADCPKEAAER